VAKFRRGFKADCERLALEIRGELDLTATDRLDPHHLADHLAIPAVPLTDFSATCSGAVRQLVSRDRGSFSAATVFCGTRRMIVYNPTHSAGRHANNVAHELGHVLLEHEPGPIRDESGQRRWSDQDEREADHLGATLLVPRDGILPTMYRLRGVETAADHFGVSVQLMEWRFNETGAKRQMQRAAAKRRW
jgi:Zn-dependent peptidase ImmA (M78 family)